MATEMGPGEVQISVINCPDGTRFRVFADGTWVHETWGGDYIRNDESASTTHEEVLAKLGL